MAKYPKKIISLRKDAVKEIPVLLRRKPLTLTPIYDAIKKKHPENCDDSISCSCGNKETSRAEWKHQVRWALQDFRYSGQIDYDVSNREYSLKKSIE